MRRVAVLCAALAGCGGPAFHGGEGLPPAEVPSGRRLSVFTPEGCSNASGAPSEAPPTEITLISREDGKLLLVEARPGYDSLVVHNAVPAPRELTFQVISTPDDEVSALREYRVEWPGMSSGELSSSLSFEIASTGDDQFHAAARATALRCRLVKKPARAPSDLDSATPLGYETQHSSITRHSSPWQ